MEMWKSVDEAVDFMFRAHPLLRGHRPVDVVTEDDGGAQGVKEIIGRLRYGSAA